MGTAGSTYSPGSWYAVVSPTVAAFLDPTTVGARLDALWEAALAGRSLGDLLDLMTSGRAGGLPAFALAAVEGTGVRVVVRGPLELTVEGPDGLEVGVPSQGIEPWWEDTLGGVASLWIARPGGGRDGLALPLVSGVVTADILAWQPFAAGGAGSSSAGGPGLHRLGPAAGQRTSEYAPAPSGASRAASPRYAPVEYAPVEYASAQYPAAEYAGTPEYARSEFAPPPGARDPLFEPFPDPRVGVAAGGTTIAAPVLAAPVAAAQAAPWPVPEPASPFDSTASSGQQAGQQAGAVGPARYGLLHFSTGEMVDVDGPVVIGRAPQAGPGEDVRLVTVKGVSRGISRMHVRVAVGPAGVYVVDLGSRNGSAVHSASGGTATLEPGVPHVLRHGDIVAMADVSFEFRQLGA